MKPEDIERIETTVKVAFGATDTAESLTHVAQHALYALVCLEMERRGPYVVMGVIKSMDIGERIDDISPPLGRPFSVCWSARHELDLRGPGLHSIPGYRVSATLLGLRVMEATGSLTMQVEALVPYIFTEAVAQAFGVARDGTPGR